jgi:ABC-type polysaccharide/polyol phosphate export permease
MIGFSPDTPTAMGGYRWAVVPLVILLAIFFVGYRTFSRMAPRIAEEL